MTGRHPFRSGIYYANVGKLPEQEITIAEHVSELGYRTGFFGKWHVGTLTNDIVDSNRGGRAEHFDALTPPADHGFDVVFASESKMPTFDPMIKPKTGERPTWWNALGPGEEFLPYGTHYWDENGNLVSENLAGDDTRVIVDRALPFITESVEAEQPFLAVIWTHTPHLPVVASDEDRDAIATNDPYEAHYYGSILAMDREIGRVRAQLRELGIQNNTIIWFMSDNGPEYRLPRRLGRKPPGSTGGHRGSKRDLYEGGIRVPSVIEWPAMVQAGASLDMPMVTSDILPTILDIVGQSPADDRPLDGVSVLPALLGEQSVRNYPIAFESAQQVALIGDRYKIIHRPESPDINDPNVGRGVTSTASDFGPVSDQTWSFELYDLVNDPAEEWDLSDDLPEIVADFTNYVEAWRTSVAASIAGDDYVATNQTERTSESDGGK